MNSSRIIAPTLGPCLAVIGLTGILLKRHAGPAPEAPVELHAGVAEAALEPAAAAPATESVAVAEDKPQMDGVAAGETTALTFDVVRVDPRGDAVVAGHGAPDSTVVLLADGQVVAETKADSSGQFVLLPPSLAIGEHSLALSHATPEGQPVVSAQQVAVSVPAKGKGEVMVALAEPGKATVLLKDPTKPSAAASAKDAPPEVIKAPDVAIKTAEVVEPGGFFATGQAGAGAKLRLYLNGSPLSDVTAAADGGWSVRIGKGFVPGHYALRADQLSPNGSVQARAEVPLDYGQPLQQKRLKLAQSTETDVNRTASAEPRTVASAPGESKAVVPEMHTAVVERGNNLWRISRATLGRGHRFTEIYVANASQIRDPRLIYPGQIFVIPGQVD